MDFDSFKQTMCRKVMKGCFPTHADHGCITTTAVLHVRSSPWETSIGPLIVDTFSKFWAVFTIPLGTYKWYSYISDKCLLNRLMN